MHEVRYDLPPVRRMRHFGMELKAEAPPIVAFEGRVIRILRDGHRPKAFWQASQLVPVRVPNLKRFRQIGEQRAKTILNVESAFAELAPETGFDFTAQVLCQDLQAITNAENGKVQLE